MIFPGQERREKFLISNLQKMVFKAHIQSSYLERSKPENSSVGTGDCWQSCLLS